MPPLIVELTISMWRPRMAAQSRKVFLARHCVAFREPDTYLSTKVGKYTKPGSYGEDTLDYSRTRIRASLDESAARLGVDYFDLIHIHDIEYQDRRHTEWALS